MTSRSLALAVASALLAGTALAQTPIRLGQSIDGNLTAVTLLRAPA